ncbi:MAG TPA: hypothetical protein VF235_09085 [Actinomycetota bacterium]
MSTATKPYVVPDGFVAIEPDAERSGWMMFAGIMFLIGAVANLFWGLGALDNKEYLDSAGLLYSTMETWGWVAVIWGAALAIGAVLLFARVRAAAIVGIVLASVSLVFWMFAMPVYPLYALVPMLLDALIIYGLAVHAPKE